MGETMAIIRKYANELEAIVAKSVLEANEIHAVILRDDAGGMLPVLHLLYPVRLAVRAIDMQRALEILDSSVDEEGSAENAKPDEGTARQE